MPEVTQVVSGHGATYGETTLAWLSSLQQTSCLKQALLQRGAERLEQPGEASAGPLSTHELIIWHSPGMISLSLPHFPS